MVCCFVLSFHFLSPCCRGLIFVFLSWSDDAHAARRRYKKDLDQIKPDLVAYNRQKEVAMGLAPGTLVTSFNPTAGSSSSAMQVRLSLLRFWNKVIITFF